MMCEASGRSFRSSLAAALQRLSGEVLLLTERLSGEVLLLTERLSAAQRAENQELRRRCGALELQLRAAREEAHGGGAAGGGYPPDLHLHHGGGAAGAGGGGPGKCVQEQQQQQQQQHHPPTIEGIFGKDWCSDLWREEQGGPERKERLEAPAPSEPQGPPPISLLDSDPDLIFVKEEAYDDQPIGQQMRARDHRKSGPAFQQSSLHRNAANELRLQPRDLHNFPLSTSSQTQPQTQQPQTQTQQQGSQSAVPLIEHLIEDSGLSSFVDDANPSQATAGGYSDCMNNAQHHNNNNNNSGSSNGSKHLAADQRVRKPLKTFECLFCGKIFNYLSSLKVHIRRHSGEKPFSCPVCGKRFAQKTYLKLHQRVHSGEKPYSCQQCGKSFSQKSSLNIHLRTHTGEKPYSCVDCGKSYAYKYGFNHHQCFN